MRTFYQIYLLLILMLASACSTLAPIKINPSKLAYAILDKQGNPSLLCFDTISPNHCVQGKTESLSQRFNLKRQILLQKYILILGEPSQIDCKVSSPRECRVYFDHIHVDITLDPDEFKTLNKEFKKSEI